MTEQNAGLYLPDTDCFYSMMPAATRKIFVAPTLDSF